MKTALFLLVSLLAMSSPAQENTPAIIERGAHHRVFQWTELRPSPSGRLIPQRHRYTVLSTGIHYWSAASNAWLETESKIELTPEGAAAVHGPHQAFFAPNLNTPGSVVLGLPDGRRLPTHVLGLAYVEEGSGRTVLIAEAKDSVGQLHPPNQVIYPDAFDGVQADVKYTYTQAGLEQDIIFRAQVPEPQSFGLSGEGVSLQTWTEFTGTNAPTVIAAPLGAEGGGDELVDFGGMHIGGGWAFSVSDQGERVPVTKRWVKDQGRQILVERVPYSAVHKQLQALPRPAGEEKKDSAMRAAPAREKLMAQAASGARPRRFPPGPVARPAAMPLRLAAAASPRQGFVLDYQTLLPSLTNYVFKAGETYLVTNTVYLYGSSNVLEGGTVIKYASNATLSVSGALACQTDFYRPAILTARDDHSVGEAIGTNALSGLYANPALFFNGTASPAEVRHLRVSYANTALQIYGGSGHQFRHLQLAHCGTGISDLSGSYSLGNALFWDLSTAISASSSTCTSRLEHVTLDQVTSFGTGTNHFLTNCLLTAVGTNAYYSFSGVSNVVLSSASNIYETFRYGSHYLATNSPYRDAGTTNISADLQQDFSAMTTWAPTPLTNVVSTDLTLTPLTPREDALPDPGYHYPAVDYGADWFTATNQITVTVSPGTAIACYGDVPVLLADQVTLVCEGTPQQRIHFVYPSGFQESGTDTFCVTVNPAHWSNAPPTARFRFTDFEPMLIWSYHFYSEETPDWRFQELSVRDCSLYAGALWFYGLDPSPCGFTNNLLFRQLSGFFYVDYSEAPQPVAFQNNLFWGGYWGFLNGTEASWTVQDNLFDAVLLETYGMTNTRNAYVRLPDANQRFFPTNSADIVLTNLDYVAGPLGAYYQPTNSPLIDAGSTNANLLGFYHFVTTTNQVKEADSIVDCGLHYLAVDANGNPLDSDGDGIPDYLEDLNGNGSLDSGETAYGDASDCGLWIWITRPRNGSCLP